MESSIADMLETLAEEGQRHDAGESDRTRKRLNLEPATASTISTLLRAAKSRSVLEIGTSNGYSTAWLAWTVRPFNGRIVTIDRSAEKHADARRNLSRAGLVDIVTFHCGDATDIVKTLGGPFDAVFFDADRVSAPAQLRELLPKLSPRALLLADNALSHPDEIAGYLQMVGGLAGFTHRIIPVGKGLSVARRME